MRHGIGKLGGIHSAQLPNATAHVVKYSQGLYRTFYNSGWWAKDPTWFTGKTPSSSSAISGFALSLSSAQTGWSYMWVGYLKPDVTGTWTISASAIDDSCAAWVGPNAISGYTWANADGVANSADIGSAFSFNKTLTAGTYYPMRVMYGNNTGPGNMALYWNSGSGNNASWSGKLFYNPVTNGF